MLETKFFALPGLNTSLLWIFANFWIIDQNAIPQIQLAQRLQEFLLLTANAQVGNRTKDIGKGAPLGFRVDIAPNLQRVPAQWPGGIGP